MAGGRRGQSDVTLGGGHVAVIFLGVVVLCGVFFSLGYVMGKNGNTAAAQAAHRAPAVDAQGNLAQDQGATAATGWDFYPQKVAGAGGSSANSVPGLTPGIAASSSSVQPTTGAISPGRESGQPIAFTAKPASVRVRSKPPALPGATGQVVALQVAALANKGDALALAGFLKQKGYPAFAWGPAPDRLFHVQVGPYLNARAAETAKRQLEHEGFKSILKR